MSAVERYAANLAAIQKLEQQVAALKKENEGLQSLVETALLNSETLAIATPSGVLAVSDELSVSAVDDAVAVGIARQHGVKISTRSSEYVHTQTLKSAIVKKQIPFSVAKTFATVVTKSSITLK